MTDAMIPEERHDELAALIVGGAIMKELKGRSGLRQQFDMMDEDVEDEIRLAVGRAALSAAGVGKLVEALGAAPIFSKYHTGSGFDYIRFADDYHAWKKQVRSAFQTPAATTAASMSEG